jgi:FkbM family methyltransferase
MDSPRVIIDCGANNGYASVYFLHHFPEARVIAVEPDPSNAELCRRNVRQFGDRAVVVEKAIWGSVEELEFVEETKRLGEEWGIQVQAKEDSGAASTVEGIDIPTLIGLTGFDRIDILKIDIEGSEINVFQSGSDRWLPLVDNIAIELHGFPCAQTFHSALAKYVFREVQAGDITMCLGMRPKVMQPTIDSNLAS